MAIRFPLTSQLWPSAEMERFLPPLELADGIHVDFLQAIPIFESELVFKRQFGADALMRRWEAAGAAVLESRAAAPPRLQRQRTLLLLAVLVALAAAALIELGNSPKHSTASVAVRGRQQLIDTSAC